MKIEQTGLYNCIILNEYGEIEEREIWLFADQSNRAGWGQNILAVRELIPGTKPEEWPSIDSISEDAFANLAVAMISDAIYIVRKGLMTGKADNMEFKDAYRFLKTPNSIWAYPFTYDLPDLLKALEAEVKTWNKLTKLDPPKNIELELALPKGKYGLRAYYGYFDDDGQCFSVEYVKDKKRKNNVTNRVIAWRIPATDFDMPSIK